MIRTVSAALICSIAITATAANDKAERLEQLRERIAEVKRALSEDRARQDEVSAELRRLEERIGSLTAEVDDIDDRIDRKTGRIDELRREYDNAATRLDKQRRFLRRQIRAAFTQGREAYLQLLLNQEDADAVDRVMVYYDYFNEARSKRIRDVVRDLERLRGLRQSLDEQLADLESLRDNRRQSLESLRDERGKREDLLARLRQRIGERDERLGRLRADAEQLSDLVTGLRGSLSDIPDQKAKQKPLKARKGDLDWPLRGEVLGDFGARRVEGMSWNGLLIGAEAGKPVRAVAHGRVVFADWLRGMGLLIIIDHGDGYMTLYGHNQSLYSETGDWVSAGDVVASVGASGGRQKAALYFELRSEGQPIDPTVWLGSPSPTG